MLSYSDSKSSVDLSGRVCRVARFGGLDPNSDQSDRQVNVSKGSFWPNENNITTKCSELLDTIPTKLRSSLRQNILILNPFFISLCSDRGSFESRWRTNTCSPLGTGDWVLITFAFWMETDIFDSQCITSPRMHVHIHLNASYSIRGSIGTGV